MDKLIKGITRNKEIRFMAIDSTNVVREAAEIHKLDPLSSVILGRVLSAALMMASDLKSDTQLITIKIESDGPINNILATAGKNGSVKGLLYKKKIKDPARSDEIVSMKEMIGQGQLIVIKDLGLKSPYIGQVELKYGTIARDLTYYFAKSEQTHSSVGLGVLMDDDNNVRQAGGFIIQIMPETSESSIEVLETNLHKFPNLTDILDMDYTIEEIIERYLLNGLDPVIREKKQVQYKCDCSREKFRKGIALLSKEELEEIISDNKKITLNCHFCNKDHKFDLEEIVTILNNNVQRKGL